MDITVRTKTTTVDLATGTPAWQIEHTSGAVTDVADITAVRIVPGDVLLYSVPATITAQGQNLRFQVGLAGGSVAAVSASAADTALAGRLTDSAVFGVTGATPVGTSAGRTGTLAFDLPAGPVASGQLVIVFVTKLGPDGSGRFRAQVSEVTVSR